MIIMSNPTSNNYERVNECGRSTTTSTLSTSSPPSSSLSSSSLPSSSPTSSSASVVSGIATCNASVKPINAAWSELIEASPIMTNSGEHPKDPLSAFTCFLQIIKQQHTIKHPHEKVSWSELNRKCTEKWKDMTEAEKKRFEAMAQLDLERYRIEITQFQLHQQQLQSDSQQKQGLAISNANLSIAGQQIVSLHPSMLPNVNSSVNANSIATTISLLPANCIKLFTAATAAAPFTQPAVHHLEAMVHQQQQQQQKQQQKTVQIEPNPNTLLTNTEPKKQQKSSIQSTYRKRKRKDPLKPKRPMSAFFFFSDRHRKDIKTAHPEYKVGDVAKELGKMWEICTNKSCFESLATKDRFRYESEMDQFRKGTFIPKQKVLKTENSSEEKTDFTKLSSEANLENGEDDQMKNSTDENSVQSRERTDDENTQSKLDHNLAESDTNCGQS